MTAGRASSAMAASGVALVLLIVLAPIQSTIWNGSAAPAWMAFVPWIAPGLQRAEILGGGLPAYDVFGRLTILAYALLLFAMARSFPIVTTARAALAWRIAFLSVVIAAVTDIFAYWVAGLQGEMLRSMAFWGGEVPALLVASLSMAIAGLTIPSKSGVPRRARLWLVATPLLAFGVTLLVQYMPHGPLIGISTALLLTLGFRR